MGHVTLLYGGLLALLVTLLGTRVSLMRLRDKKSVGAELGAMELRMVRAHGNAAEWIPLGILLLLLLELSGVGSLALHVLGGALVVTRVLHAYGISTKTIAASRTGATLNYGLMLTMSVWVIVLHFGL